MDFNSISVPIVKGLSQFQIEKEARIFLDLVSPESALLLAPTPVQNIFENRLDLFGFRALIGKNIKGLGGFTDITHQYIQLSNSTYRRVEKEDPQARFTLAHEFGHMKLHANFRSAIFARRTQLKPFEDPEWQANAFAAAVLMPLEGLRRLSLQNKLKAEEVMRVYKVSWSAATRRVLYAGNIFRKASEDAQFSF